MHKLLVLYNEPKDPTHFRKYYVETHLPLVSITRPQGKPLFVRCEALGARQGASFLHLRSRVRERGSADGRAGIEGRSGGCR